MAGNKNSMFFLDLGFAQNSTTRMQALQVRKARGASPNIAGEGVSAAAKFIVLCEQEHGIPRKAFRELIVEALRSHNQQGEREYFLKHEAVFNDWLYGNRATPTWVMQIVAEVMFGMLRDNSTTAKLKKIIVRTLPQVIEEIAGGQELLAWIVGAHGRMLKTQEDKSLG